MRFATSSSCLAVLASLSFAAAQNRVGPLAPRATSTSTSTACDAQYIVDVCRSRLEAEIKECGANDWICLCDHYTSLLTCYDNCPNSADRAPVTNQVSSYCAAAAPLKSASAADAATRAVSSTVATSAGVTAATGTQAVKTATATATATGAAGVRAVPAGGVFAVVLGLAGLL
ncbi:hypothetical protein K504DRAFT_461067 [Pleomassaria siparia CBS 279.74]|uniref:GPI anchored serine-threonine rich protein n=1 Tax=Pleomassaria siparia CBS 279.74 TaxID=1314801 RepID=A0A6G1JX14_9PLEO|nr:hypothetical protein K504DRAFT_461067 [Pleomassaria siparia CBS 279.74]